MHELVGWCVDGKVLRDANLASAAPCYCCGQPASLPHLNCANIDCNRLFLACPSCQVFIHHLPQQCPSTSSTLLDRRCLLGWENSRRERIPLQSVTTPKLTVVLYHLGW